jgi:hypothetical protein
MCIDRIPLRLALCSVASGVVLLALSALPSPLRAQTQVAAPARVATKPAAEAKPRWQQLSSAQHDVLRPLEREWPAIDGERKQKWLAIAAKYPAMSPQEQARVQERMADWSRLSPQERGVARQQFQAAKRAAPEDRPAQWEAYMALPPEKRREFADRALVPIVQSNAGDSRTRPTALEQSGGTPVATQRKSNIVPNPAYSAPPIPITPTAVQAQPGATTTSIAKRASPPPHQQPGLTKIAASPGFVDKTTLLPKRGPQGAAVRSSPTSEPTRNP